MSVIGDANKALSVTNLIYSSVSDISVAPLSDVNQLVMTDGRAVAVACCHVMTFSGDFTRLDMMDVSFRSFVICLMLCAWHSVDLVSGLLQDIGDP